MDLICPVLLAGWILTDSNVLDGGQMITYTGNDDEGGGRKHIERVMQIASV